MDSREPVDHEQSIADEAAAWIVRWDRGLAEDEKAAFERWKALTPAHAQTFERGLRAWKRFDSLASRRAVALRKDEALAEPVVRRRLGGLWLAGAAALLAMVAWVSSLERGPASSEVPRSPSAVTALVASDRRFLADGSVVDLSAGASVEILFTPGERRVRLNRGAAHFQVMRDPARPFVVITATGVEVRALGTSFDVWMEADQVDVRVATGKVQVKSLRSSGPAGLAVDDPVVEAGHRVVIPLVPSTRPLAVAALAPLDRGDASSLIRYEFERTPLSRVVAELNRHGGLHLEVADPELADLPIYASCRTDNLEAFVRLLETTGELSTERMGTTLRLKRAR